jgi:hypothetical protein
MKLLMASKWIKVPGAIISSYLIPRPIDFLWTCIATFNQQVAVNGHSPGQHALQYSHNAVFLRSTLSVITSWLALKKSGNASVDAAAYR